MNHSAIKYELLNKWLPQSNSSFAAANETISDFNINLNSNAAGKSFIINIFEHSIRNNNDFNNFLIEGDEGGENEEDVENLLRCIYVLQDGATESVR